MLEELLEGRDFIEWLREQGEKAIQDRMFNRIDDDLDQSEGSYIWDATVPAAFELAIAYIALLYGLDLAFMQTSYGEHLTLQAASRGTDRRLAQAATGVVTVHGSSGTEIPAGTPLSTTVADGSPNPPKYYLTDVEAVIPETEVIDIPVTAETPGTVGNVAPGEINLNIRRIRGIYSVTNNEAIENGIDEESDTALMARALERVRNPPSSGNKKDYIRWAQEVPGVGNVRPIPLHNGPGTVKVVITAADGGPASNDIINAVQMHLDPAEAHAEGEGTAPIGAFVTVSTVTAVPINITIPQLLYDNGYYEGDVRPALETRLQEHLVAIEPGDVVRMKEVESIIKKTPGVKDFHTITMNGVQVNVLLGAEETATLGEVVIS